MKKRTIILIMLFISMKGFAQFATFEPIITIPPVQQYTPPPLPLPSSSNVSSQDGQNYTDCNQIPSFFNSWREAFVAIATCYFNYVDRFDAESSFITGGVFKSCDGQFGFLVVFFKDYHPYIYQNVPISVWEGFKNALSKGTYYNNFIRGNYRVYILR
jgi:hypothetical protein